MLRIGNSFGYGEPAKANLRMFRAGPRRLSSYGYHTLDLEEIGGEKGRDMEVDELQRLYDRFGRGYAANVCPFFSDMGSLQGDTSFIAPGSDGWAHVKVEPGSEVSSYRLICSEPVEGLALGSACTVLFEVKDASSTTLRVQTIPANWWDADEVLAQVCPGNEGEHEKRLSGSITKARFPGTVIVERDYTVDPLGSDMAACVIKLWCDQSWEGDVRISLYDAPYYGAYKPYDPDAPRAHGKPAGVGFRPTDPRATTGASFFATLDSKDGDGGWRVGDGGTISSMGSMGIRTHGINDERYESAALRFTVRSDDCADLTSWYDNSNLWVSNIMWEFNTNCGDGRWYQLYDIPNRAYTRVNLPDLTNHVTVRAVSNDTTEWVQGIAVTPVPYRGLLPYREIDWEDLTGSPKIDPYGRLTWTQAVDGHGTPIYHVYKGIRSRYAKNPNLDLQFNVPNGIYYHPGLWHEDDRLNNPWWAYDPRVFPAYLVSSLDEEVPKSPCIRVMIDDRGEDFTKYRFYYDDAEFGRPYNKSNWPKDARAIPCFSLRSMDEEVPVRPCLIACKNYLGWDDTVKGMWGDAEPSTWTDEESSLPWNRSQDMVVPFGGELVARTRSLHFDIDGYEPLDPANHNLVDFGDRDSEGFSITANEDGTMSVSGRYTGADGFYFSQTLKPGDYTLSAEGKPANLDVYVQLLLEDDRPEFHLSGKSVDFTVPGKFEGVRLYVNPKSNANVSASGIKVQIAPKGETEWHIPLALRPMWYVHAVDVKGEWVTTDPVA